MQRLPLLLSQFKSEGSTIKSVVLQTSDMQAVSFPKPNEKSVVIFWATWCAPCSLELKRINNAVINKEIDPRYIYAVNMGEDPSLVKTAFTKREYKFQSYYDFDKKLAEQLKIEVTPTVLFIDEKQTLTWISSGVSPSLIYRIQIFLN